jgi:23S rRNA (adenine2503-C2)-methyltransferase
MMKKPLIFDLSYDALETQMKVWGQPGFRAEQMWVALYQQFRQTPQEITTFPKSLREKVDEIFDFRALTALRAIESEDGQTIKTLFRLRDGELIEAVLMYYDDRRTLCVSSQSGCGMSCTFCATGQMGLRRNLTSGEVIAQVLYYARLLADQDDKVTNVVVMGMGEPFHNYENVMEALNRLNDPEAFGMGARRFTISTVGLTPQIKRFADEGTQYNLAVSLHTVDNELRSEMMPINRKYPVEDVLAACRYYIEKTNRRITFEIALISGVNDSPADAEALAHKIEHMLCHVNLIPLNPTKGFGKQGSNPENVRSFCKLLEAHHIPCTVRLRRGIEIGAGCGQLAAEHGISS